jgi:hypothetical protein
VLNQVHSPLELQWVWLAHTTQVEIHLLILLHKPHSLVNRAGLVRPANLLLRPMDIRPRQLKGKLVFCEQSPNDQKRD